MSKKKEPKPFYDQTFQIPYTCEKCGHEGFVVRRVYSRKVVVNEPVKPEYDIQHFVEPVSTVQDFIDEEQADEKKDEAEKEAEDKPEEKPQKEKKEEKETKEEKLNADDPYLKPDGSLSKIDEAMAATQ